MLTVAVLHAKAGYGKTTVATNPAAPFALQGRSVALCDLDAQKSVRRGKRAIAFVTNRYRRRTRATAELGDFLSEQEWPVLGRLRDTQLYTHAADAGPSIFELHERRALEQGADD